MGDVVRCPPLLFTMPFFAERRITANVAVVNQVRVALPEDMAVIRQALKACAFEVGDVSDRAVNNAIRNGRLLIHDETGSICRYYVTSGTTHISELCVLPEHRGKGIGKALLGRLKLPMELTCRIENPSNEFYRHLGFRHVGTQVFKKWTVNVWRFD